MLLGELCRVRKVCALWVGIGELALEVFFRLYAGELTRSIGVFARVSCVGELTRLNIVFELPGGGELIRLNMVFDRLSGVLARCLTGVVGRLMRIAMG